MCDHFSSRIQEVLQYDPDASLELAKAMITACLQAFPSFEKDLLPLYHEALKNQEPIENNNDKGFKTDLLEFRQLLHCHLRRNVREKQGDFR